MTELVFDFNENIFLNLLQRIHCYAGQHTRHRPKISRSKRKKRHPPREDEF